jgi:hypothetical protein
MKRILTLDGGGIRGVFTLEVLLRMQELLRAHTGSANLVLADHFDFMAGTSTGAIIASCLSWGMPVEEILSLYVDHGTAMFHRVAWYRPIRRYLISRYQAKPLSDLLQKMFSEDGEGRVPALLSTGRLKTLLLVVVRNQTTGSAWPITNNPRAKYNDPALPDCNLKIPLWKIVRASTAAPVFFDPEEIVLGENPYVFVDGAITPYNNPALIAALTAVLPCYQVGWEPGPDKIRLVSVGTMRFSAAYKKGERLWLGYHLPRIPAALIDGIGVEQDYVCRCLGDCIYGENIDSEIGNLVDLPLAGRKWFSYVRYDQSYLGKSAEELLKKHADLASIDSIELVSTLREMGRDFAEKHVRIEHLV